MPFYSGSGPGSDQFLAAAVRAFQLILGDRGSGSILANPVIASSFKGARGLNAIADRVLLMGYGLDNMAAVVEGVASTPTTITSSTADVTPARQVIHRVVSDLARALDSMGTTEGVNMVMDGTWAFQRRIIDLIAALFPSITATAGTSGATLTWSALQASVNALEAASVAGPYVAILHPTGWGEAKQDGLTLGGAVQHKPEIQGLEGADGQFSFKGSYLDGSLAVYTSNEIDTSGPDNVQGVFGHQFMQWEALMPLPSRSTDVVFWSDLFGIETERTSTKNEDAFITSTNAGVGILQNPAGIKVLSAT